jgi:inositol transport system permease protein
MSFFKKLIAGDSEIGTKELLKTINRKYGIFLIFILLIILVSALTPNFLTPRNLINVVRQISFVAIIAIGSTLIIIISGIDLSPGAVMAFAAVVAASLAHPGQFPVIVPILAGLGIGVLMGFINAFIIAKSEIPPFIVTLGMFTGARGAALLYTNGKPIGDFSDAYIWLGSGKFLGIPVPILLLAVVAIFTHIILNNTKLGRHIYALGGNEQAAIISGVNVFKVKLIVFTYGGFLAALSAISLSARIQSGQPSMGLGYELDAIAGAVIGGTSLSQGGIGTIPGTIIGSLIIGVINNGMDLLNINSYWQQIVKAVIIVGAVLLDKQKNK